MNVLVTGGTGTVGLAIVERLAADGAEVTVYTATEPAGPALQALRAMPGRIDLVQGDVRDGERLRSILATRGIHSMVHAAAVTPGILRERDDPASVVEVNVVGAVTALTAFDDTCAGRFVHLGSIAAYGSATTTRSLLVEESGQERPGNLYEITKLAGEQAVLRVAELRGREAVSLRLGDVFGCWEHRTAVRDMTSAPFQTLAAAMAGRPIVLPRAGTKAWVYTMDVAEAVLRALEAPSLPHRVANISSPYTWSVVDWCARLAERFPGMSSRIDPDAANITMFADNAPMSLARAGQFGYTASYGLDEAFEHYLAWAQRHPAFLR